MYLCKFSGEKPTGSFRRQSSEKADFTGVFFKDGDLGNEVTLKFRSMTTKSYQLFILHNDTIQKY